MPIPRPLLRLRLWQRLFLAFAALSAATLSGFLAWQQHAFRSGFAAYLDEVALQRILEPAAERIGAAYAEQGDWSFLVGMPTRFDDYIDPGHRFARPGRAAVPEGAPPRRVRHGDDRPASRRRPPHPLPRVQLVDARGARIAGTLRVDPAAPGVDIVAAGRRVGRLLLQRETRIDDAIDAAFARTQAHDALFAGVAILAAALVLAFALARWLLAPIRALARGTRALAGGDYASRVDAARGDELGDLAGDFNHLAQTLERSRDARRQWGADIAHELRTPLAVLRGEVQALQDGIRAPTPAAFESLQAECTRLAGLVDDLYQLALADSGALEYRFETLDLTARVRDAAAAQVGACADAGIELGVLDAPPMPVHGDARRLGQLVDNLLANARRYTDAPGRVQLSLETRGAQVRLLVDDTPPGVPEDALPRLFDRLYRVDRARSRASGGAGLGLAICRAIVEAHGGRIEALASPLGGLRVVVELPAARPRA